MKQPSFKRPIALASIVGMAALAGAWAIVFSGMFASPAVTYPGLVIVFLLAALALFVPLVILGGLTFSVMLSGAIVKEELTRPQLMMFLVLGIIYGALASLGLVMLAGQQGTRSLQFCSACLLLSQISVIYFTLREDRRSKLNQVPKPNPSTTAQRP